MPANISARALEEADSERMMMPSGPSPIPLRALLLPRCPCVGKHTQPPFITKSSFPRAAILGLQHALIAFATITIVPNRVASVGRFELQASHAIRMYAIIVTALASLLQCARLSASPLPTDFSQWFSARTLPAHVGLSCQFSIAHLLNWQLGTGIISLLGAPLLLLPVIERAMVDGMLMDSSMTCNSDFDCTNSWANAEGVSIEGVSLFSGSDCSQWLAGTTNVGQCSEPAGLCKYSGEEVFDVFNAAHSAWDSAFVHLQL
jgi:hypothetical protein